MCVNFEKRTEKKHFEIFASVKGKSEFETKVICTETKSPVDEKIDRH
jgi:hypothetical protein